MRRSLVVTLLLAASIAHADTPVEDPMTAARERGIVLKGGKSHYFVVIPPVAPEPGRLFDNALVYYGDTKTLYAQIEILFSSELVAGTDTLQYEIDLVDWRTNKRRALTTVDQKSFALQCDKRTVKLTAVDDAAAKKLLASAKLAEDLPGHSPFLLARAPVGTTYYFVDRPFRPDGNTDFRLFIGKRGAMKQQKLKEVSADTKGVALVTAQGLLQITVDDKTKAASFGRDEDHQKTLNTVPLGENLKLVFGDLGVYAHESFAMPCDDL